MLRIMSRCSCFPHNRMHIFTLRQGKKRQYLREKQKRRKASPPSHSQAQWPYEAFTTSHCHLGGFKCAKAWWYGQICPPPHSCSIRLLHVGPLYLQLWSCVLSVGGCATGNNCVRWSDVYICFESGNTLLLEALLFCFLLFPLTVGGIMACWEWPLTSLQTRIERNKKEQKCVEQRAVSWNLWRLLDNKHGCISWNVWWCC